MFITNINKLPLLIIIYITNTLRSFLIAYYFITLESIDMFIFINKYIRKLFFYNSYLDPIVILRNFTIGLIAAIVVRQKYTISKVEIEVTY